MGRSPASSTRKMRRSWSSGPPISPTMKSSSFLPLPSSQRSLISSSFANQAGIAGHVLAELHHLQPEAAGLLDLVAELHLRPAAEAEVLQRDGERGPELVDREAAAGEQVHLRLADLDRRHALTLRRRDVDEAIEQGAGMFRPGVDAAVQPEVLPLLAVGDEPRDAVGHEDPVAPGEGQVAGGVLHHLGQDLPGDQLLDADIVDRGLDHLPRTRLVALAERPQHDLVGMSSRLERQLDRLQGVAEDAAIDAQVDRHRPAWPTRSRRWRRPRGRPRSRSPGRCGRCCSCCRTSARSARPWSIGRRSRPGCSRRCR